MKLFFERFVRAAVVGLGLYAGLLGYVMFDTGRTGPSVFFVLLALLLIVGAVGGKSKGSNKKDDDLH